MAKTKSKVRRGHSNHQDDPKKRKRGIIKRDYSQTKPQTKATSQYRQPSQRKAIMPFEKYDRILLVGEGDFSFTLSLLQDHRMKHIVATCFDSEGELHAKYPSVEKTLEHLNGKQSSRDGRSSVDATRLAGQKEDEEEEEWSGFSLSPSPSSSVDSTSDESFDDGDFIFREDLLVEARSSRASQRNQPTVHYGINATKLSTSHRKLLLADGGSPFSKIVFNFPHVGGLSTDVNRQVRSNQELLVGFFEAAKGLLASESNPVATKHDKPGEEEDEEVDFDLQTGEMLEDNPPAPLKGQILVTLFEGDPYTLWNIRDLARHCGLKMVESFKFPWSAYPAYRHARTLGEISGSKTSDGQRPGAWRGEERDARMYVLEVKEEESSSREMASAPANGTGGNQTVLGKRKKKRKKKDISSDDGSDASD